MKFNERIKAARKAIGLSCIEAQNHLDKPGSPHLKFWENGRYRPMLHDFMILANIYGMAPDELYYYGDPERLKAYRARRVLNRKQNKRKRK